MLQLTFQPFTLQLLHPFTIASNTRTSTPIVLTAISYQGFIGYGEASMPPYLGESQESVQRFLSKVDLKKFDSPFQLEEILAYVDEMEAGNTAAKASIDIALHDLIGKLLNQPWHKVIEANALTMPATSLTIGIDSLPVIQQKVKEAAEFSILKVKLGNVNDREIINSIREISNQAICVDVNQGWTDKHFALEMLHWLKEKNVLFVEQAMAKEKLEEAYWLYERSPLPLVADEAVQRFHDIEKLAGAYHGINIKLMKCTGMREAYNMIQQARKLKLKVLIGCMNESSCANMAAAQLAPLADWVDLDGPFMIRNNPFESPVLKDGKIVLSDLPGIGVQLRN